MKTGPRIAILAGARETRDAVRWLAQTPARPVIYWARGHDAMAMGIEQVDAVPRDIDGLLDVTHAFDTETCTQVVARCPQVPLARVARAPWVAQGGDRWEEVDSVEDALTALPAGARVFAATGRDSLPVLARHDGPVFLRQLSRHDDPTGHDNCRFVFGDAPFDPVEEAALFKDLRIDVILARNIGGTGSFPKLAAARALGLPAVLVRAPQRPEATLLRDERDVARWVSGL